jgi:hypothetical protein
VEKRKEITTAPTKPTFADIAKANTPKEAPWTTIQSKAKAKSLAQELAPKKATELSERRVIFLRDTFSTGKTDLSDLILAINLAIKKTGLPEHIRFLRMSYTTTGSISGLLGERATAAMLCPTYNDTLINIARKFDPAIIGVQQAEQWYKLRVHKVSLKRYLATGLKLAQQEIESTQSFTLPLSPFWLGRKETILERYSQKSINYSTIVITVRNKQIADRITANGLFFGGHNHKVDRFWEIGPGEICSKCCEYGHTAYKACKAPPRCYICSGAHDALEHKCPVTDCSARTGKPCIHLPIKCTHCKGAHMATSAYCPKRKQAIEIAKKGQNKIKKGIIEVVIPKRVTQTPDIILNSSPPQVTPESMEGIEVSSSIRELPQPNL